MLIFRQLFDSQSSTYTYLLADSDTGEAVLIDTVFEQVPRDAAMLRELNLKLVYTLDTHVHADHVTGASLLKAETGCQIAISAESGAAGAPARLSAGFRYTPPGAERQSRTGLLAPGSPLAPRLPGP